MLDLRKQLAFRYAIAPRLVGHDYPRREIEIKGIVVRLAGQTIEASLRRSFRPLGKVVTPDEPAAIYAAGSSEVPDLLAAMAIETPALFTARETTDLVPAPLAARRAPGKQLGANHNSACT